MTTPTTTPAKVSTVKVADLKLSNSYIKTWMSFTSGGETPDIYHLWGAIVAMSSALGRECYYKHGVLTFYPNLYVILTGASGNRKSMALGEAQKLLREYTGVVFGPNDSSGKRQGTIRAFSELNVRCLIKVADRLGLEPPSQEEDEVELASDNSQDLKNSHIKRTTAKLKQVLATGSMEAPQSPDPLASFAASVSKTLAEEKRSSIAKSVLNSGATRKALHIDDYYEMTNKDKWALLRQYDDVPRNLSIFADELINYTGQNNFELISFLTGIYGNPSNYDYSLARLKTNIVKPCLTFFACTTPSTINTHLPEGSISVDNNGFGSRVLFVYSPPGKTKIFMPKAKNPSKRKEAGQILRDAYLLEDEFGIDEDALELAEYTYVKWHTPITDSRFYGYFHRRLDTLFKVCMCLAAGEGRLIISKEDVADAHTILTATEDGMPEALGEAGKEPVSKAKDHILTTLAELHPDPHNYRAMEVSVCRDIPANDFRLAISELQVANRIRLEDIDVNGISTRVIMMQADEAQQTRTRITSTDLLGSLF